MIPLTASETEAVLYLAEYEIVKIAADKRCVSEHTEKNQIKSAMAKLGVTTQIGLVKEFFRILYGIEFNLMKAREIMAACLLVLFISTLGNTDQLLRRSRRTRRRVEYEFVLDYDNSDIYTDE
jgi:DNA-binding CsgD family transcriptional regulator